jgi:hypothetical protein
MRTKTLLLSAALGALSGASLMAQVYSLNEVGYINVTLAPGFNQIANQLSPGGQGTPTYISPTLDAQLGTNTAFVGSKIYKYNPSSELYLQWNITPAGQAAYNGNTGIPEVAVNGVSAAVTTINPGEGVWFFNKQATNLTLTFVGAVSVTNATLPGLTNGLGAGFNFAASVVPVAGAVDSVLGIAPVKGDHVFIYDTNTLLYDTYVFTPSSTWSVVSGKPAPPSVGVGQAFWYEVGANSGGTNIWVQHYGVGE